MLAVNRHSIGSLIFNVHCEGIDQLKCVCVCVCVVKRVLENKGIREKCRNTSSLSLQLTFLPLLDLQKTNKRDRSRKPNWKVHASRFMHTSHICYLMAAPTSADYSNTSLIVAPYISLQTLKRKKNRLFVFFFFAHNFKCLHVRLT